MLHSLRSLRRYSVRSSDGRKAALTDWLFGDRSWTVRYAVVRIGVPFLGREVLLQRSLLKQLDSQSGVLQTGLTYDQLQDCPDAGLQLPISKQKETELHAVHGYAGEWSIGGLTGAALAVPGVIEQQVAAVDEQLKEMDPHLRSARKVRGYRVMAREKIAGGVADFILDDTVWGIPYVVVRCRGGVFGKRVLLPTSRITAITWDRREIVTDLTIIELREGEEANSGLLRSPI